MYKGIYITATGSMMQENRLDMIINNIANVNNDGYKKDFPIFESYLAESVQAKDTSYVVVSSQAVNYSQGALKQTSDPLDVAIEGDGFFKIQTSDGIMFTRKGDFTLNSAGNLITQNGDMVLGKSGPITVPKGKDFAVDEKGNISIEVQGITTAIGSLDIVNMKKPYPIKKTGNGLFKGIGEVKELEINFKDTSIKQGFVEASNVTAIDELVNMISASREYESYQKVISSIDEINSRAATEIGRIA